MCVGVNVVVDVVGFIVVDIDFFLRSWKSLLIWFDNDVKEIKKNLKLEYKRFESIFIFQKSPSETTNMDNTLIERALFLSEAFSLNHC